MKNTKQPFIIPANVPQEAHATFQSHYNEITYSTGNLMLFSCDQKIEHLNTDFYGKNIPEDAQHPEHLFEIASKGRVGAMATHPGLIARYGQQYPDIVFIAKLNGKTNIIPTEQKDPFSAQLWDIEDVLALQEQQIAIAGVGLTIYLGSAYEAEMLEQAAQTIVQAHQHGLLAILWIYPRGKAVTKEDDFKLIAGAAGVANSLGADFVKVKPPHKTKEADSARLLKIVTAAAGNTKVICSGGAKQNAEQFLQQLYNQIQIGGTAGNATGRNIFQRSFAHACAMTEAISAIVYDNKTAEQAMAIYKELQ